MEVHEISLLEPPSWATAATTERLVRKLGHSTSRKMTARLEVSCISTLELRTQTLFVCKTEIYLSTAQSK
jgi:hypothetical protein